MNQIKENYEIYVVIIGMQHNINAFKRHIETIIIRRCISFHTKITFISHIFMLKINHQTPMF